MTITAPTVEEQGWPDNGPSLLSDPWSDGWAAPTNGSVAGRHAVARRRQQERHRIYGVGRVHVGGKAARRGQVRRADHVRRPPSTESQRARRQQRLRAVRISLVIFASCLIIGATLAAYWLATGVSS